MAICTGFINPLDIECLFVNVMAGNSVIFQLLFLLSVVVLAAIFRMPTIVFGMSVLLIGLIFYQDMQWFTYAVTFIGFLGLMIVITKALVR